MSIIVQVAQQKRLISEQLGKLDAERSALQHRLDELRVAERVLSRLAQSGGARAELRTERTRAKQLEGDDAHGAAPAGQSIPLGDATLAAVRAHPKGASSEAVRCYLDKEFGLQVRPNHLGMALQRHRRAGRIEVRNFLWRALQ